MIKSGYPFNTLFDKYTVEISPQFDGNPGRCVWWAVIPSDSGSLFSVYLLYM